MSARAEPETFEISVAEDVLEDMRERLARTRWPEQPPGLGFEHGMDILYLREVCDHWSGSYDWRVLERALNGLSNWRWDGIHFIWERASHEGMAGGMPVVLIHG